MNIAMIAKKGGVGKTTCSLLTAEALRQAGYRVAVHDFDEQGTSSKSLRFSGGELVKRGQEYHYVVYDTPPSLEDVRTNAAVRYAAVVIVVTSQSMVDMWEVPEAVAFAKRVNPAAVVKVLVNQFKAGTILARNVVGTAQKLGVELLNARIPARETYAHFVGGGGWDVLDKPGQSAAVMLALEISGLTSSPSVALVDDEQMSNSEQDIPTI